MELTVNPAQLEAVRGAKHLPEALQRVLAAARASARHAASRARLAPVSPSDTQ